jgi:hypothetical protein
MLSLPFACVVFLMSQHVADINLVSIIMHCGDQSNSVAADIEDGEFPNLICVGKVFRNCTRFVKRFFRMIAYQRERDIFPEAGSLLPSSAAANLRIAGAAALSIFAR